MRRFLWQAPSSVYALVLGVYFALATGLIGVTLNGLSPLGALVAGLIGGGLFGPMVARSRKRQRQRLFENAPSLAALSCEAQYQALRGGRRGRRPLNDEVRRAAVEVIDYQQGRLRRQPWAPFVLAGFAVLEGANAAFNSGGRPRAIFYWAACALLVVGFVRSLLAPRQLRRRKEVLQDAAPTSA